MKADLPERRAGKRRAIAHAVALIATRPVPLRLSLFVFVTLLTAAPATAATYTFTKIVESQSRDPIYSSPAVNNSGAVAYRRRLAGSPDEIHLSQGGVTTKIADSAGPLSLFGSLDLNDAGTVVFFANLDAGGRGIFTGNGGPLATIITTDDESPLGGAFTGLHSPSINASGAVSFMGQVGARRGIFKFDNGAVATVVDDSGPLKDFGFSASPINDDGLVAFSAAFDDRPLIQGVFTSSGNGGFTTIGESRFGMTASSLNNAGALAFHVEGSVSVDPHGDSIFVGNGGPTQTIAGSELNRYFVDHPAINNAGLVAYAIIIDASGVLPSGIYTGPDATKVIQHGDPLFGSFVDAALGSINHLGISSSSLNDAGQIAFTYFLANGRTGVALATPVPEPCALAIVGWLVLACRASGTPAFSGLLA